MGLGIRPYTRGLHDIGNHSYAWLQPDGGWGWSNAGLIVDGDVCMLVDTLFDKPLTQTMLDAMRSAEPRATGDFEYLVNTHSNGDHCNGNELVGAAQIIASQACLEELAKESPAGMLQLLAAAPDMGELGKFFTQCFGQFDFRDIKRELPNHTFEGSMDLTVGDKAVALKQVGPAHTHGDVLVHVPADRTVFTGDILFIEGHPILWAGPVKNWIEACDYMCTLDVDTVVPGHGPITDKRGVQAVRGYLSYIESEARKRYDQGMDVLDACRDINFSDYDSWGDGERIAVNVAVLYKEFAGDTSDNDVTALFGLMAQLNKERRG
jgi:glyoxylase-like metal-dependent hydrolase (beta-lactamase superfamily II)